MRLAVDLGGKGRHLGHGLGQGALLGHQLLGQGRGGRLEHLARVKGRVGRLLLLGGHCLSGLARVDLAGVRGLRHQGHLS